MTPLKILTVAGWMHPDAEGGSFRFLFELNRALARRGHRVTVLTGRIRSDLPARQDIDGIRVIRYPVKSSPTSSFYLSTLRCVRNALDELDDYDLVHLHHPVSAYAAARVVRDYRPIVQTLHIAYFLEYLDRVTTERTAPAGSQRLAAWLLRQMESRTLGLCSRVAVLSEAVAGQVREHFPGAAGKLARIPGGVDFDFFCPGAKHEAREKLELPADRPILLTVRRLEPRMGIDNLLDAMPAILEAEPRCLLMIAGRGSMADTLHRQADELGLSDAVRFTGFVPEQDLPSYYRAADLFVLPTRALEGFGMATLEAFACGTPAVVTPVGGSPELAGQIDPALVAGGTGPQNLAAAVLAFLNRADRDDLARRCREFAETFSWDSIAEQYENLYEQAIQDHAAAT